jgi:peptide/nickel transport system permease protein
LNRGRRNRPSRFAAIRARGAVAEFWASGVAKAGVALLLALTLVSIYVLASYPLDFGKTRWNNPALWADYPKAVPPAWVNLLTPEKGVEHLILHASAPSNITEGRPRVAHYYFTFTLDADGFPTFTSLTIYNVTFTRRAPTITASLIRPDGYEVRIYRLAVPAPRSGESSPYTRYVETPKRVYLTGESAVANALSAFAREAFAIDIPPSRVNTLGPEKILFGVPDREGFRVLEGTYRVRVDVRLYGEEDRIGGVRFVLGGTVYGAMGTDTLGRDLSVGLLFGFPVALFIGVVTSLLTTLVGAILGVMSGYLGGYTDTLIQRFSDIVYNIPLLPLLIFFAFALGQNIWVIIFVLVAFGWPSLTIVVRSMVLQTREAQFVEAAIALGASRWWIMFRHIFPQVAPFVFAQLIFFTPSAILAEAALSFLGLGDPTLPTWGQILEYGFRNGGVYVGYWWWIVPPGVLIVLTAVTFVLLALALEPVVNPRLRRMR